jgi:hypothetical protein
VLLPCQVVALRAGIHAERLSRAAGLCHRGGTSLVEEGRPRARLPASAARGSFIPGHGCRSGTLACCSSRVPPDRMAGRPRYWSWLLVLVVVAVAHRRLGPSSSATTSTVDRALPSPVVRLS